MPEAIISSYVFLSDLHLASGFDPVRGSYSPQENFFYDKQFARFLKFIQRQAQEEGQVLHLVLLGDIFDFLRASSPSHPQHQYSLDASAATAVEKIEQIAAGHSVFFEALGCLLEAGFHVELMPGNHDIEMTLAAVQEKIRELVKRYGHCSDEAAVSIQFHPWIYYVPGVFYAEHGQQQHWINSFPDLPELINQDTQGRIRPPVGSHFEIYLQALRNTNGKPEDEHISSLRSLILEAVKHPTFLLRTGGAQLRFLAAMLNSVFRSSTPLENARRKSALQKILPALSSQAGLSSQTLTALAKQWRTFDLTQLLARLSKQMGKRTTGKASNYLYQSAITIHELLMYMNEQVPYYVFGHTHQPAMRPLASATPAAYYVNGGSWTGEYDSVPQPSLEQNLFRYIFITAQPGSGHVQASILAWNDSTGLSEPIFTH